MPKPKQSVSVTPAATETDHEWKTRMAAEGRAIYHPGKSAEEVRAELAATEERRAVRHAFTLELTEEELGQLDVALPDLGELVEDAAAVLSLASDDMYAGCLDPEDTRVWSALRLAGRALRLAKDRELAALDMIDARLRSGRKGGAE